MAGHKKPHEKHEYKGSDDNVRRMVSPCGLLEFKFLSITCPNMIEPGADVFGLEFVIKWVRGPETLAQHCRYAGDDLRPVP